MVHAIILLAAMAMTGEDAESIAPVLPDNPRPAPLHSSTRLDKGQWAILGADIAVRSLDVYSTHKMLGTGHKEIVLPDVIATHTPALIAYESGCVWLNWQGQKWAARHNHRTLGKIMGAIDVANVGPWAVHNLFLEGEK